MNEKKSGKLIIGTDFYISIALIILCIAAAVNAMTFPVAARRFPLLSCGLLGILAVVLLVRTLMKSFKNRDQGIVTSKLFPWSTLKYALITFVLTGGYIFLMEYVDFFVGTVIFVPVMMIFMRVKSKPVIVLSTAGITFFCWFMFVNQLRIHMP